MMQTFLPYPDFTASARCLDRQRLGKQRVECLQLLRTLLVPSAAGGWARHPAALMWRGCEMSLGCYMQAVIDEWVRRGYKNNVVVPWSNAMGTARPPWLGDEEFHASHRSNLLRKDACHYGQFGWTEPSDLPYVWPSKKEKTMTKTEALNSASIAAMSLEELQTLHSDMCAQAGDLGFEIPETLTVDFETQGAGVIVCDELNDQLSKFRAGLDIGDTTEEGGTTDGQSGLATASEQEHGAKAPKKPRKSPPKKAATTEVASTEPKPEKGTAKPKEAPVAKAVKKTAPKKSVAKKTAPAKKVAKASATENARAPRVKFDDSAKVTFLLETNPCRAGSSRFDRYELLRKGSGQTVKTLLAKGVPSATLANASVKKIIKIG